MGSVQVTPTSATPVLVPIPVVTGSIVLTNMGTAECWVTSDGSLPVAPSNGVNNTSDQQTIPPIAGAAIRFQPRQFGDHMAPVTLRIASTGSSIVQIQW